MVESIELPYGAQLFIDTAAICMWSEGGPPVEVLPHPRTSIWSSAVAEPSMIGEMVVICASRRRIAMSFPDVVEYHPGCARTAFTARVSPPDCERTVLPQTTTSLTSTEQ
jgi:hypothetical protein